MLSFIFFSWIFGNQVQSYLSGLVTSVSELEQQHRQRSELQHWIKKQLNSVSDWMSRPCKLRPEAAKQELAIMNDLLNTIGHKRSQLMTDMTGSCKFIKIYIIFFKVFLRSKSVIFSFYFSC